MNYVLFNHLSNNGAGESRADALLKTLGVTEGEEYKKIDLVGLSLTDWLKAFVASLIQTL